MNERQERILALCNSNTFIYLKDLVALFPTTSEMTLRRDIEALAAEGLLVKIRGGARRMNEIFLEDTFAKRAAENYELKTAVAAAATQYLKKNSLVFIDSGSTTDSLARLIHDLPLTIYTTGTNIANILCQKQLTNVYLTGGKLNGKNLSLSGEQALSSLENINFDIAFMTPSGYAPGSEFSCGNADEAAIKRYVISKSSKVIMLLDETKVTKSLHYTFCTPAEVDIIVTGKKFPSEYRRHIKAQNANIYYNITNQQ